MLEIFGDKIQKIIFLAQTLKKIWLCNEPKIANISHCAAVVDVAHYMTRRRVKLRLPEPPKRPKPQTQKISGIKKTCPSRKLTIKYHIDQSVCKNALQKFRGKG